jgi:hypothetical protein
VKLSFLLLLIFLWWQSQMKIADIIRRIRIHLKCWIRIHNTAF